MSKYRDGFLATYKKCRKVFQRPKLKWFVGKWTNEPNLPVWRSGPEIKISRDKTIKLPIWLAFHWYNKDMVYKTKWTDDDYRFEFPPYIALVFFGLAISVTAVMDDTYWESMLTYLHYNGDLEKTNDAMGYCNDVLEENFRFRFKPEFIKDPNVRSELSKAQLKHYAILHEQHIPIHAIAISTKIINTETHKKTLYITTYKKQKLLFNNVDDANTVIKLLQPVIIKNKDISYQLTYYTAPDLDEFVKIINAKPTKEVYKAALIDKEKFEEYVC